MLVGKSCILFGLAQRECDSRALYKLVADTDYGLPNVSDLSGTANSGRIRQLQNPGS